MQSQKEQGNVSTVGGYINANIKGGDMKNAFVNRSWQKSK